MYISWTNNRSRLSVSNMQYDVSLITFVTHGFTTAMVAKLWAVDLGWEGARLLQGNTRLLQKPKNSHNFAASLAPPTSTWIYCYPVITGITVMYKRWINFLRFRYYNSFCHYEVRKRYSYLNTSGNCCGKWEVRSHSTCCRNIHGYGTVEFF